MKKDTVNDPFLVNSVQRRPSKRRNSYRFGRTAGGIAASIIGLIILIILLALPITVLVIGTRYRDPRYCPIEPRISLLLIVHGSVSLASIVFMIVMILMTIFVAAKNSMVAGCLVIILTILLYLILTFSVIWLIIGGVWTFSVHNRVTHHYDTVHNYYLYTYCHPVLYKFTFAYLIISYVLSSIQFCYQILNSASRSSE